MILPSWATHLAIDEDGEVGVFDRAPMFLSVEMRGIWAHPDRSEGRYTIVVPTKRMYDPVYPVEVAERLCVSLEGLPAWTTCVAFDTDGALFAYAESPVWCEWDGGGGWMPSSSSRCEEVDHVGTLDVAIARRLCFAISAPS